MWVLGVSGFGVRVWVFVFVLGYRGLGFIGFGFGGGGVIGIYRVWGVGFRIQLNLPGTRALAYVIIVIVVITFVTVMISDHI